jgi:hypothetical protein
LRFDETVLGKDFGSDEPEASKTFGGLSPTVVTGPLKSGRAGTVASTKVHTWYKFASKNAVTSNSRTLGNGQVIHDFKFPDQTSVAIRHFNTKSPPSATFGTPAATMEIHQALGKNLKIKYNH